MVKKKRGRPKIKIDYKLVSILAKRFETQEGIAEELGCSASKLQHDKKFLQAFNKGKNLVKKNLRVAQYKYALRGNSQLLIWLGKVYLGQKDPQYEQVADGDTSKALSDLATAIRARDQKAKK